MNSKLEFTDVYLRNMVFVSFRGGSFKWNNFKELVLLKQLLDKFAPKLKRITFNKLLLTDDQFILLLDTLKTSKMEELNLIGSVVLSHGMAQYPNVLVFPHLKTLNCSDSTLVHSEHIVKLFQSIESSSPLTSFTGESIIQLFSFTNTNKMRLKTLSIANVDIKKVRLADLISRNLWLQSLDILDCWAMDDVVNEICKLEHLHTLGIALNGVSHSALTKIRNHTSIKELRLKFGPGPQWLQTDSKLNINVKKLYLDIRDFPCSNICLRDMLFMNLSHLHLITSNVYSPIIVLGTLTWVLPRVLESCTIEIVSGHFKYPEVNRQFIRLPYLKDLTIINRTRSNEGDDCVIYVLKSLKNLERIHIEGFSKLREIHRAALLECNNLKELTIITNEDVKTDYIFDDSFANLIEEHGGNLQTMRISCSQCTYRDTVKFPRLEFNNGAAIFSSV
jgi:hypothetical protein